MVAKEAIMSSYFQHRIYSSISLKHCYIKHYNIPYSYLLHPTTITLPSNLPHPTLKRKTKTFRVSKTLNESYCLIDFPCVAADLLPLSAMHVAAILCGSYNHKLCSQEQLEFTGLWLGSYKHT